MNRRELIIEIIQQVPAVRQTGVNDPGVVEIQVPGKPGPQGKPGTGSYLLEADEDTPPSDTPTGTIIYRKA